MNDSKLPRPQVVNGMTYKIRPGDSDAPSLYMTINDVWYCTACVDVNENGKPCGKAPQGKQCALQRRPFEVFFSARCVDHYEWLQMLGTLLSSILRQPGPFPIYVIEELTSINSLKGGHYVPAGGGLEKGTFVNGVVHHIGLMLELHCKRLGIVRDGQSKKTEDPAPTS